MAVSTLIAPLLEKLQPRAASFIVTIYGDVVVPRGEVLWTGSLIETCERAGISENLVRTATSRLVSAGRLEGERIGRRSFYRLADAVRAEFADASHLLYTTHAQPRRWFVLSQPQISAEHARQRRMARMGGDVWLCPDWGTETEAAIPKAAMTLEVTAPLQVADADLLRAMWDFGDLQARYSALIETFAPTEASIAADASISDEDALICRLLLVHAYRSVLLRDPCLPAPLLPRNWRGAEARTFFGTLYLRLSPQADAWIGKSLVGYDGLLAARTAESDRRLRGLRDNGRG
ncbi:MAG: PaaX family transcriptional regulator C-terminal domain-containing protein [Rhizobiaceae bacterium]